MEAASSCEDTNSDESEQGETCQVEEETYEEDDEQVNDNAEEGATQPKWKKKFQSQRKNWAWRLIFWALTLIQIFSQEFAIE
jgi:hypothetical protein